MEVAAPVPARRAMLDSVVMIGPGSATGVTPDRPKFRMLHLVAIAMPDQEADAALFLRRDLTPQQLKCSQVLPLQRPLVQAR